MSIFSQIIVLKVSLIDKGFGLGLKVMIYCGNVMQGFREDMLAKILQLGRFSMLDYGGQQFLKTLSNMTDLVMSIHKQGNLEYVIYIFSILKTNICFIELSFQRKKSCFPLFQIEMTKLHLSRSLKNIINRTGNYFYYTNQNK